ncbi:HAD-IB family hydrolase [Skermanella rosea]|uniref:HAD-IB family hydrolase n=1 Tax=Skermanella rosea TaxID=1817965 RepID=UPI001E4EA7BB|nr:HAD-IB family hydrolase [Skermanella rosea]UEM03179.1 HAD-IB family hydrolase [Skermanella rosea]
MSTGKILPPPHPSPSPEPSGSGNGARGDRQGIAFFDFDGTLVRGDSLLPFLSQIVGSRRARLSLARAVHGAIQLHATRRQLGDDIRTSTKAILLRQTLAGVPVAEAEAAAERLAGWTRWNRPILDALKAHQDAGRRIVVATGALALYMPVLLRGLGVDDLLATGLEEEDGILTGHMKGGNCVRAMKAQRVSAYLHHHGPFGETWGYGNRPSDVPMLALLNNKVIV